VTNFDTVEIVKAKIQDKLGLPPKEQILIYKYQYQKERILEDGHILSDYTICKGSTIYLKRVIRGGH
jgi:hypothetical protein